MTPTTGGLGYRFLRRYADVKPGEAAVTLRLFLYFFLMMAAAYVILPLKTSLFLKRLGPEVLPFAYLATAVLMSFVAAFNMRLLQRLNRKRYVSSSLLFFIVGLVLFWFLFKTAQTWVSMAFWFWSEIFLAISVIQFWILVNDAYSPRQAKKYIGFFVSGGLLGGVAGSLVASLLPAFLGPQNLPLVCLGLLLAGWGIISSLPNRSRGENPDESGRAPVRPESETGFLQGLRVLSRSRYLVLLSGIMLASFAVTKIIDYQFSASLKSVFLDDQNDMTAFLGAFNSILLIASYVLHILLSNRILRDFGMRTALLFSPVILAAGAIVGFVLPAASGTALLVWTALMRGTDKSLSHSLSQSTREILYIPVPPEIKYKAKLFIDLFVNKLADSFAALLLLVFSWALHVSIPMLSVLTLALILIWAVLNHRIIREYVGIVKKNLALKWPDADKLVFDQIDVDATKLVFDTLESRQKSSVLYAMNLLDLIKKEKMSPELKKIIAMQSSVVQAGSFDTLLNVSGEALVPEWDDALEDADLDVQIREVLSLDVYQQVMKERVEKIAEAREGTEVVSQMEIAKALGMMSADAPLVRNLGRLLKHESPEVVRYALESAGRQKKKEFVPAIVPHLGRAATRQAAVQALLEYGDSIAGTLKDHLADPEEDLQARRAIPDILGHAGTQRAADALLRELKKRDPDVQSGIIEALSRMRSRHSEIKFRPRDVEFEIFPLIRRACGHVVELAKTRNQSSATVLTGDHENHLARTVKQIFELLGLIYSSEDITRAFQNFTQGTKRSVDYSLELLEQLLGREIKAALLPLLEDRPLEEKAQVCRRILKSLDADMQP